MELKKKFPFLEGLELQFHNPSGTDISSVPGTELSSRNCSSTLQFHIPATQSILRYFATSRGAPSRHFSIAFSKNSILGFCYLPIKLNPLSQKMAFFLFFGPLGGVGGIYKLVNCIFAPFSASPLAPLACLTKIPGDPGRPVEPVGWSQRCKTPIS